ncbi:MAG: hypothetical protein AAGD96_09830 [Chloroflexota bacterium]
MQNLRAQLYAFAFLSERRKFLGIAARYWIQLGLMVLTCLWLWLQFWSQAALTAALILLMNYLYATAARNNYAVFVEIPPDDFPKIDALKANEKIAVHGTGTAVCGRKELRFILASGEVELNVEDELEINLKTEDEQQLQQLVMPEHVKSIQLGNLSLAGKSNPAVEAVFMLDKIQSGDVGENQIHKIRKVTLSFESLTAAQAVFAFLSTGQ